MSNEKFKSIAMLAIEKKGSKKFNLDIVEDKFSPIHNNKKIILGFIILTFF